MDKNGYVISYDDWREDPLNEGKDYGDYMHEEVWAGSKDYKHDSEWKIDLIKEAIQEWTKLYFKFKREGVEWKCEMLKKWIDDFKEMKKEHEKVLKEFYASQTNTGDV